MIYHVSVRGRDDCPGTEEAPFRTIGRAAEIAVAGDTVRVHDGVYREWVNPKNGGISDLCRIVYEAAPGEHPVIKGSEIVTGWEPVSGTVWKKVLPNAMFGDFNPYADPIDGDWLKEPVDYDVHSGDVYINGESMYEASSMEDLYTAEPRIAPCQNGWRYGPEQIPHPEKTIYRWYAEVNADTTVLYGNFQDIDPNTVLTEINVRKCCFYPTAPGLNYITVRGFEIAQAACPFNPPTADQIGMVGPHWAKGWIIENNHLHDAKCSAIALGKDAATGHNLGTRFARKSGHRYQAEAMFMALQMGWSKEKIGSHVVRNNVIHDCGQNGIVGHLGCVFSRIEHNHIYNIGIKHEFWGHELGGIKFHAAIDVVIENNNIHDCTLGTWLDWESQGTRLTRNVYHHNNRDLMMEVTHGPCLVDNNLFLSPLNIDNQAQGTAFVHNLFAGRLRRYRISDRATPYHFPHSTQVLGYAQIYSGDDRVINNLILGGFPEPKIRNDGNLGYFSSLYDVNTTEEEYKLLIFAQGRRENQEFGHIRSTPQPVWIAGNAYAGAAEPFRAETDPIRAEGMAAEIEEKDGQWTLTLTLPAAAADADCAPVTTERLGTPRLTEEPYENPDGTPVDFTGDFFGAHRGVRVIPGPFAGLTAGTQTLTVWQSGEM